ncbi:helix-turn-helix transcriptional regulator [Neptuniibacter sp.]|uniref:helix-turn-helix domain-containing protein n=1 Tax=Neptuniibacter sp. TaxID=1962643 RepID=UPI0026251308|nr:helix-turn-helix transcriptional regulator [Neptuniibacter sp.]MCP4597826.1 helix-turn-helix transcriptional regulator [Neptuniibacter sp.]
MDSKLITPTLQADLSVAKILGLTPRQIEASSWAAEGKTDEEIGLIMECTARTAKAHVQNAMKQTDTHTRAQLVAKLFIKDVFSAFKEAGSATALCLVICITGGLLDSDHTDMNRGPHRYRQSSSTIRSLRRD